MIGTKLAHYSITAHLGSGGMGDVYQASDSKLGRSVAIKLLPAAFASDPDRLSRFRREAQLLASLNHPNIAHIYGLEESGDTRCIVMELIEGETLQSRIKKGPIPVDEALTIAKQIAEALEAAHEKGVIHRDLKPGNVMLTSDGRVKVLDFGLAKAYDANPSSASQSNSPTMASLAATNAGVILGTAAYMAPEQARGKTVDRRADIWAFGAVLFEMLTGARPFDGEDLAETIGAVIHKEPVWSRLPSGTPSRVQTVLQRCLQKDPKLRLRDAGDVRLALEGAFETVAPQMMAAAPATTAIRRLGWFVAFAVALLVAAALAFVHFREKPSPETRVDIVTPATDRPSDFALSPDGRQIVFVASGDGASRLWLRSLAKATAQPLPGTEGATLPFWSPEGQSIGFFAAGALKRIDLGGGAPQTLAPALSGTGATWNSDGVIVFAPSVTSPLMRVPAAGGAAVAVTTLGPSESAHVAPTFLPGGQRFLYFVRGAVDVSGIYLGALAGSMPTRLTSGDNAGVYFPTGWMLWKRAGALVAQRLDLTRPALTGEQVTIADGILDDGRNVSALSAAAMGLLAYRTGESSRQQLTWVDRSGAVRGVLGPLDGSLLNPIVASDGRRVIASRSVQGNIDLWMLEGPRMSRLTFDPAVDMFPLWSPDGSRIAFRSTRTAVGDLYVKLTGGADAEQQILTSNQLKTPSGWTADGRFLLYMSQDPQTASDLWVLPMSGNGKPFVFLKTPFREAYGAFSPDGRWVAYQSNESGRMEIYVRPFVVPGPEGAVPAATTGRQWQISATGGISPLWRPDGKELYYLDPSGALTAVPIATSGTSIEPGTPVPLFQAKVVGGGVDSQQGRQYDVAPDGRFLINRVLDSANAPITLLQNWNPGAKK